MNGSSFPTQTVGADRIRPQHKAPLQGACAGSTYSSTLQGVCVHPGACEKPGLRAAISRPYRAYAFIRVLPEIWDYGRLLAAPTGRMRSTGYLRKSGVTGGYPPLQGVYAHPGACEKPGLRADSIRPYNCGDRAAPADSVCKCSAGKKIAPPLARRGNSYSAK